MGGHTLLRFQIRWVELCEKSDHTQRYRLIFTSSTISGKLAKVDAFNLCVIGLIRREQLIPGDFPPCVRRHAP